MINSLKDIRPGLMDFLTSSLGGKIITVQPLTTKRTNLFSSSNVKPVSRRTQRSLTDWFAFESFYFIYTYVLGRHSHTDGTRTTVKLCFHSKWRQWELSTYLKVMHVRSHESWSSQEKCTVSCDMLRLSFVRMFCDKSGVTIFLCAAVQ